MNMTFEQETIERARMLSPSIDDYFTEQKYKMFTGDECQAEEITDRYLLHVALELLFQEVKEMGIEADLNVDDFIDEPAELSTLFALRSKFDSTKFYELLKSLSNQSLTDFLSVYESISLPEDLLLELGPWFAQLYPSDEQWQLIGMSVSRWYSTEDFGTHLSEVVFKILNKTDLNKAVVNDANIDSVSRFLNLMKIRRETITVYIRELCKKYPEQLNRELLDKYIRNYDIQKLNNDQLPLFAAYNDLKPKEEPEFLKQHHLEVNHHIEYWEHKYKLHKEYGTPMPVYTKEIAVMLVVSLVLDHLTERQMRSHIAPLKDIVPAEEYEFTVELTKFNYDLKG